jgi:APA family basic amino acid/polyamine antiporter
VASSFQQVFTLLKGMLILVFIVCGFLLATPQDIGFLPSAADPSFIFSAPFAISMVYVTYSYSGWNASIYLASDIESPEKNLPRSLLIGTAIVMVLYLLLNFIFLYSTPIDELAGQLYIGYIAGEQIFGSIGAKIMGLLISFGLISSISSMVFAGPRVTQVIGEDIPAFQILAKKNATGIPDTAIFFQLAIVIFFVITATFESVITYLGFTLTLSSFLTVLGVFVHRIRYPEVDRPYKTWGYPITPIIFLGISLWILIFVFRENQTESLLGLGTIALGLPVYFFAAKKKLMS